MLQQREYMDIAIYNYINIYFPEIKKFYLINIFDILNATSRYLDVEEDLLDLISHLEHTDMMDEQHIADQFISNIIVILNDLLDKYNITITTNENTLKYHYFILDTFKQLFIYNEFNTPVALNILSNDDYTDIEKVAYLVNLYQDVSPIDMLEVLDTVNPDVIDEITITLEHIEVSNIDVDITDIDVTLTDTYIYKLILDNDDLNNVTYDTYSPIIYNYMVSHSLPIIDLAKNLYVVIKLDNTINDKIYFLKDTIINDLEEFAINEDDINTIFNLIKEYLYKGINND